jgi:hypothetical protein
MIIEIVNVTGPTHVPNAKGGYHVVEVAYKQDGKITGKKLVDFNNPELFALVTNLEVGKFYDIASEKNARGYWDWTAIAEVEAPSEKAAAPAPKGRPGRPAGSGGGRVVGNTYETHEERALNRAAIVRQFSINAAIEFDKSAELDETLKTAAAIEDHVYADLPSRMNEILSMAKGE